MDAAAELRAFFADAERVAAWEARRDVEIAERHAKYEAEQAARAARTIKLYVQSTGDGLSKVGISLDPGSRGVGLGMKVRFTHDTGEQSQAVAMALWERPAMAFFAGHGAWGERFLGEVEAPEWEEMLHYVRAVQPRIREVRRLLEARAALAPDGCVVI